MAQLPCIGLSWPLTNRHLLGVAIAIYFHYGVTGFSFAPLCHATLTQQSPFLVGKYPKEHSFQTTKTKKRFSNDKKCNSLRFSVPQPFVRIAPLSGWWFRTFFIFTPNPGEMIQFDFRIFFNWGW